MPPKNPVGTVIIKKIKKEGYHKPHGGAWKVAYADFVTAMMAFFLLLWLLNVTTDVQKRGIADYFDPTLASKSSSGAGGVLGGATIGSPGSAEVSLAQPSLGVEARTTPSDSDDTDDDSGSAQDEDDAASGSQAKKPVKLTADQFQQEVAKREEQRFDEAKAALEQAVKDVPALQGLAANLMVDETPEGLRIQIVDQDKQPMYPLGSADLLDPAKKLLALVTQVVNKLPNKISITGHTDSVQYSTNAKYTNWELSADRANAARREFLADGLPISRLDLVAGVADQQPLDKKDPGAPHNRRISIVLLRAAQEKPDDQTPAVAPKK